MKTITPDTKRALEVLEPIADELALDIKADHNFLYIDGQPIGIACNSTYATIMEAIGWMFQERYKRDFRRDGDVERYWCSPELAKSIMTQEADR